MFAMKPSWPNRKLKRVGVSLTAFFGLIILASLAVSGAFGFGTERIAAAESRGTPPRGSADVRISLRHLDVQGENWQESVRSQLVGLGHPDPDRGVAIAEAARRRTARPLEVPRYVSHKAPRLAAGEALARPATGSTVQYPSCGFGATTYVFVSWQGPAFIYINAWGVSFFPPLTWVAAPGIGYGGELINLTVAMVEVSWYKKTTSIGITSELSGPWIEDMWCS
jgi:hypothetical protein